METKALVRTGINRLSAMGREALYLRTGLDVTLPESIQCEVVERCNFKCRYCHFWRMSDYAEEMGLEEWKRALLSLKAFVGACSVRFVGGEPFIKRWFPDLLMFCKEHDIAWGVITNGSALTATIVKKIVLAAPCILTFRSTHPTPPPTTTSAERRVLC